MSRVIKIKKSTRHLVYGDTICTFSKTGSKYRGTMTNVPFYEINI